jgi:mono/diheme cytochrome c family protein
MGRRVSGFTFLLSLGIAALQPMHASDADLERRFTLAVRPFLTSYCVACHGGTSPAAQFDLRGYTNLASVVHDYPRWSLVLEKLSAGAMPPKGLKQPPPEARKSVIDWVQAVRVNEAAKHAGDPGVVLARRLSNAEYDYTIRDLTGVDLRPAREFPVDPANPEGFDNSGESLAMSPALLNKYLQAAREVADHMVLTPDGFDFAPHPMLVETDRDRYAIQRIVDFYLQQPTDYADYFEAAWRLPHGQAASSKLSQKYLRIVKDLLEGPQEDVGPIAKLQAMWRARPETDADGVLREKCVEMRDFVVRIRNHTSMQFAAPVVRGLSPTSQPLMNWKLRQFAAHRRDSDPKALRNDTDPAPEVPVIPKYPGLGQESAFRWAALMAKSRAGDQDLAVPAAERQRYEDAFERLAQVFPDGFYIKERGRYFPDDSEDKGRLLSAGFHNVMGYFRDDTPLMELILDERGTRQLNRLWDEFEFIADYTSRTWVQYYFNQSGEVQGKGRESGTERPSDKDVGAAPIIFGLRDAYLKRAEASNNPVALEAIREHFARVNETLRAVEKMHADAEPKHLEALVRFAERAYRKPLTAADREEVFGYYRKLRETSELSHEDAIRDSIVRVLLSPRFCYRVDLVEASANAGPAARPLSPYALASRLSYFLWSSMPDQKLMERVTSGELSKPEAVAAEARRMLQDDRARGLAVEFGGNWLDFRRFEEVNTVDRDRFPTFTNELREAMFEEPVRFLEEVIRHGRPVLDLLYGKYTFVNPPLAKHYGMPEVKGGNDHWVRIDDADQYGRGGLLPMAAFLTQNAPGLRTSPVKRGNWVVKRVLGETIPPPPATVPELPRDEAATDLPVRDLLAKHRENATCAACHARFDSFGLAFEGYGPVGEKRSHDLAGREVDAHAAFPGGAEGTGVEGVQAYIRAHREQDFTDNLSRKLLAYALGRSLMLSDDAEVEKMKKALAANEYRFSALVEAIVTSPQFLNRRAQ